MSKIELERFCGNDAFRPYLNAPFTVGEFTYATDGSIMVRVAAQPKFSAPDKDHNWNAPLKGHDEASYSQPPHGPIPATPEPTEVECDYCEGRGHEHDCPDCKCTCDECDGAGKIKRQPKISTAVRGRLYDVRYIAMMLSLPNVQVADQTKEGMPLLFKFDGGIGAIMPLRRAYPDHVEIEPKQAA